MHYTDTQARDLGHAHGYAAANYAANVSGEDLDLLAPARTRPSRLTPRLAMFYDDGFDNGIDAFKLDDDLAAWREDALAEV